MLRSKFKTVKEFYMFKVAGISTLNGITKVRYANDFVSRIKMLNKGGHTDLKLFELPQAMEKGDCVKYLKTETDLMDTPHFAEALNLADEKYNGKQTVKVSMESLVQRAEAVTEQPEGWSTVNTGTEETAE